MEKKEGLKNEYGSERMVKVDFIEDEPIIIAALAAKISQTPFEEGTIRELYEKCRGDKEKSKEFVNRIMTKNRHLIFGDFLPYAITLEDITRLAAIYFWRNVSSLNLVFGAGIEASFRVVKPNRYIETVSELGKRAFEIYENALNNGVPEQDARYLLPEGTLTRMIFSTPPRYLVKLANALKKAPLAELKEIGEKIEAIVKERFGLEIPEETLPSEWKFWGQEEIEGGISLDYGGEIHSLSLNAGISGALAMYGQVVRQRLILCRIEPLEGIAKKGRFVVPPTFPEEIKKDYQEEIANPAKQKQIELIEKREPNFVYFLLLGQKADAILYGKGANVIELSRARSEGVAQWEIRNEVGIPITRALAKYPELQKEIGPRCWREKICTEPPMFKTKKQICKAFTKAGGNWQGTLEELLQVLREPYETFQV